MNDFTKEQLQEIKRCVDYMTKGGTTPYSLLTLEVKKKIQSMIENYNQLTSLIACTWPVAKDRTCSGCNGNGICNCDVKK